MHVDRAVSLKEQNAIDTTTMSKLPSLLHLHVETSQKFCNEALYVITKWFVNVDSIWTDLEDTNCELSPKALEFLLN
jgi:hypothetical protein